MLSLPHIYRQGDNGLAMYYTWFGAMHTRVDIAIVSQHDEESLGGISEKIYRRVDEIERMANCFNLDSELSAINRSAALHPVGISKEMEHILALCKRYHAMTDGIFDVTASTDDTTSCRTDDIILPGDGTIAFRHRDLRINLSGFIKGYALEQIRPMLTASGIGHALVNMGNSSIMAIGDMHDGQGWTVAFGFNHSQTVSLTDQCLTTSGNDTPQRRHIIDPGTCQLISGRRAISIINNNATEGEVLSTAHFINPDSYFAGFGNYRSEHVTYK